MLSLFICAFPLRDGNLVSVVSLLVFSGLRGIACSCIVKTFFTWSQVSGDSIVECLPDYIVYRDNYSTDSVVTFSSSCIKIEGYWQAEMFEFQWGVDHILNIECQWCERVSYLLYLKFVLCDFHLFGTKILHSCIMIYVSLSWQP